MEKINKIIDSLSPVEQNLMHYKRDLTEVLSILLGTGYSIKPNDKYENANHMQSCFSEMARLAYAIYLNTQDSFSDIIDNIKYVS